MTHLSEEQLLQDLQRKVNDDVYVATRRTTGLAPTDEMRVWLALQASFTAISVLAQLIEQCEGRQAGKPLPTTVLLACLMCARCCEIRPDCTLLKLLRAADRDLADMMQAGIIKGGKQEKESHDGQPG